MRQLSKILSDAIYSLDNKTYSTNGFIKTFFNSDNSEFPQKKLQILFRTKILISSSHITNIKVQKSNQVS